jgi:hypothetical protein
MRAHTPGPHPEFVLISFGKSYEAGFDEWISLVGQRPDKFDPLLNKLFHLKPSKKSP